MILGLAGTDRMYGDIENMFVWSDFGDVSVETGQ